MAIGDKAFNLDLQKQILPRRWFPSSNLSNSTTATPILDGLLSGSAQMFAAAYAQWQYGDNQARIATATDINLDLISDDFFAGMLPRNTGEKDDLFLKRIQKELLRPRGTRSAISKLIFDWTGNTPTIIEPRLVSDTGAYSTGVTEPYAVALDFGAQSILPNNMTFVRETSSTIQPVAAASYFDRTMTLQTAGINQPRFHTDPTTTLSGLLVEAPSANYVPVSVATIGATTGDLAYARTNLLSMSQNIGQTPWWSLSATSVSSTLVLDPNGGSTGNQIYEQATTSQHLIYQLATLAAPYAYTYSVYAQWTGRQYITIGMDNGTTAAATYVSFDIQNGTMASSFSYSNTSIFSVINSYMLPEANGWYRCSITSQLNGTATATLRNVVALSPTPSSANTVYPSYAGSATLGANLFGAQLENWNCATNYIYTYTTPVIKNKGNLAIVNSLYWSLANSVTYTTANIIASGLECGLPYVDLRIQGSGLSISTFVCTLLPVSGSYQAVSSNAGDAVVNSMFIRSNGGTTPSTISTVWSWTEQNASGTITTSATIAASTATLAMSRVNVVGKTSYAGSTIIPKLTVSVVGPHDITLRLAQPQLEIWPRATLNGYLDQATTPIQTTGAGTWTTGSAIPSTAQRVADVVYQNNFTPAVNWTVLSEVYAISNPTLYAGTYLGWGSSSPFLSSCPTTTDNALIRYVTSYNGAVLTQSINGGTVTTTTPSLTYSSDGTILAIGCNPNSLNAQPGSALIRKLYVYQYSRTNLNTLSATTFMPGIEGSATYNALAYGSAGVYGNMSMNNQVLIKIPTMNTVINNPLLANIGGYGLAGPMIINPTPLVVPGMTASQQSLVASSQISVNTGQYNLCVGGYGIGAIQYISTQVEAALAVSTINLEAAIAASMPVPNIAWVHFGS